VPPVAANPYATHEMHWDRRGGGYCTDSVARPGDNNHHSCGEPLNSPIHGGTFDMRTLPNVEKS
jgi:hypothetical protein